MDADGLKDAVAELDGVRAVLDDGDTAKAFVREQVLAEERAEVGALALVLDGDEAGGGHRRPCDAYLFGVRREGLEHGGQHDFGGGPLAPGKVWQTDDGAALRAHLPPPPPARAHAHDDP